MSKTKKKQTPTICTYCGEPATPVTWDHVFPRALWAEQSNDRPLKVASCEACNNRSNESILKHLFIVLDSRFYPDTIKHFKTSAGKGDFRTFAKMWAEVGGTYYLYLDDQVTARLVKMFMGVRRHLMGKAWFFLPPDHFLLFKLDKRDGSYEARRLPLRICSRSLVSPWETRKN